MCSRWTPSCRTPSRAVRAGRGPCFIHALTYRLTGHTAVDAASYRDGDELAESWRHDPIARARAMLVDGGMAACRPRRASKMPKPTNRCAHRARRGHGLAAGRIFYRCITDVQDTHGQGLAGTPRGRGNASTYMEASKAALVEEMQRDDKRLGPGLRTWAGAECSGSTQASRNCSAASASSTRPFPKPPSWARQ